MEGRSRRQFVRLCGLLARVGEGAFTVAITAHHEFDRDQGQSRLQLLRQPPARQRQDSAAPESPFQDQERRRVLAARSDWTRLRGRRSASTRGRRPGRLGPSELRAFDKQAGCRSAAGRPRGARARNRRRRRPLPHLDRGRAGEDRPGQDRQQVVPPARRHADHPHPEATAWPHRGRPQYRPVRLGAERMGMRTDRAGARAAGGQHGNGKVR